MSLISSMQQSMNLGILASPLTCFVLLVSIANLTLSLVNVNEQVPTAPYLTFEGRLIPNNSQVQISRIGSDVSSGVQCHTDLTACCNGSFGGQWSIFGTLGGSQNASQNTGFGQGLISLHSITGFQSGIYQCDIDTVASIASGGPREILLVGVYQGISLNVFLRIGVHDTFYTLTCTNSFSPATSVTWMKDSEEIEGGVTVSIRRHQYIHQLNTTEKGVYTCTVTNVDLTFRNLTSSATLNVTKPLPPSNLTAIQNGARSLLVSWTPAGRPERYVITYIREGDSFRRFKTAGPNDTSITLTDLFLERTYFVSIVAETALSSETVGPVNSSSVDVIVRDTTPFFYGAYPGQEVKVTCQVTLIGPLTGTPTISWQTPGPLPTPTVSSPRDQVFISEIIIHFFNSSHEGTYTCTASVENFPFSAEVGRSISIDSRLRLSVVPSIQIHSTQPLHFTAICTSTGGFPANVTWTRDFETIDGGVTVFEDFRRYRHMLNSTQEGVYMCTISNDLPDIATATLNITRPSPPSNLSVSQNGVDSVLVSWTPSDGAEYYTIYYQRGSLRQLQRAEGDDDSITIRLSTFLLGVPYSFSITAHTALQSIEVGPVNYTLGALRARVDVPNRRPVVGREYSLECIAEVYGNLSRDPTITWSGPGVLPTPVNPPSDPRRSILTFSPLKLSNGGEYSCSVHLEDFLQMGSPLIATDSVQVIPDFLNPRPRISVVPSRPPSFYAGTELNLTCDIPLNAAVDIPVVDSIQWVIDGVVLETPISSDRVSFSERSVIFSPLNFSDSSTYRCNVLFTTQTFYYIGRQVLNLNVEAPPPPEIELTAPSTVVAGDPLTLQCSVTTVPHLITPPRVELIGPGDTVLATTDTSVTLSHTLDPVLVSNSGQQYVCRAVLEIEAVDIFLSSDTSPYALTVQIPRPTVTSTANPPDSVLIGSSVTLTCTATFDPHVNSLSLVIISWGGPRVISGGQFSTTESGFGLIHNGSLTIPDVGVEDEGEYTCTVRVSGGRNILGTTTTEAITLSVFVPRPVVTVFSSSPGGQDTGSAVAVTCTARFDRFDSRLNTIEDLSVLIVWEGPRLVSGDGNYSVVDSNSGLTYTSILTLLDVEIRDEGRYTCTVEVSSDGNTLGTPVSESITVTVLAPPPPEIELTAPSTVVAGDPLTLQCSVTTVPHLTTPPRVELIGPGDTVLATTDTSVTLSHTLDPVLVSYAGLYFCKAVQEIEGLDEPLVSQSPNHTLTVLLPDLNMTLSASPSENANISSSVVISCNAILDPSIDVAVLVSLGWSGPRLSSGREGYSVHQSGEGLEYNSTLSISDVVTDDEGEYACTVSVGSAVGQIVGYSVTEFIYITVLVPRPALVITARPSGVLNTSSSVILTCVATLYTPLDSLEITWEGPQAISDDSVQESPSELRYVSMLTVSDLEKEDEGEYTCTLRWVEDNGAESSESESISISVSEHKGNGGVAIHISLLVVLVMLIIAVCVS